MAETHPLGAAGSAGKEPAEAAPGGRLTPGLEGLVPPRDPDAIDGLGTLHRPDDETNKRVNEIEMMGEEEALGWRAGTHRGVTAGMRYLHCSRTINQLVIDRNRCVTIYLAVASLLWTATCAMLNVKSESAGDLMVPLSEIHRWCVPMTAAVLAVLAVIIALLLVRIRVGLIYEVAKMNVLLGLPVGRVRRLNPFSVFFIMYVLIALGGGTMTFMFGYHLLRYAGLETMGLLLAAAAGGAATAALVALYVVAVRVLTSDPRLLDGAGAVRPEGPRPSMGSVLY